MKAYFLCLMFAFAGLSGFAQNNESILDDYLAAHRFTIRFTDSTLSLENTEIPALLTQRMQGRQLFVYGQGFNHVLRLNSAIETAFLEYFAARGLTYCFHEGARSWTVGENLFYKNPDVSARSFFSTLPPFYQRSYERTRKIFRNSNYQYLALDFERPFFFNYTLHLLAARLDQEHYDAFLKLAPYLKDTTYLRLGANKFVRFYKEQQANFYKDSLLFRAALGNVYGDFRYLLSDPEPSTYNDDRNALMASHLLEQIRPAASGDLYFMSCGMAHSRPGKKDGTSKTTVRLLNESADLGGKIVVMNLYCEACHADGGGDNWAFPFMKGAVLKSFQKAATDDIVLFDLSELGGAYDYIRKDYGDMLVFARNQY